MIFSSPPFVFVFVPVALLIYWGMRQWGWKNAALDLLTVLSLYFYAWWDIAYVPLILATIVANYFLGQLLSDPALGSRIKDRLLVGGICLNLLPLVYFKYTGFVLRQFGDLAPFDPSSFHFLLPLGISFYTFQQIAYLFDVSRGQPAEPSIRRYSLFVLFFPQLIAGPIVHRSEIMRQFDDKPRFISTSVAIGLTIFTVGLAKKLILADTFALYVNPVYEAASGSLRPTMVEAWQASIAYVFQLYFDFSGYADMATGLARCFGVRLPINFNSPYKALSVSEFWRRWHITLVRFVRSYLFQPLAISFGRALAATSWPPTLARLISTSAPVFITFVLIGLWHGAGWTFIVFGAVHGLIISGEQLLGLTNAKNDRFSVRAWKRIGLFLILCFTFVVFRAPDLATAGVVIKSMLGSYGLGTSPDPTWVVFALIGALVTLVLPNIYQLMARYRPVLVAKDAPPLEPLPDSLSKWRPTPAIAATTAVLFVSSVVIMARGIVEFIYFDF